MPARQSWRVLWVALIPLVVFPLYGQTSCDACPVPSDPCQRAAGRSSETNQCVYTYADGAVCDFQGSDGICHQGDCVRADCEGDIGFSTCIEPLSGGFEGACIGDLCVTASPLDLCVNVGVGRINCCSQQGCADADGVVCADPLDELDGMTCDPAGVTAPGQPPQNGICVSGTCVAQTGLCADVPCSVDPDDPCARNDCSQDTGQCEPFIVTQFIECRTSEGVDALCHGGTCIPDNLPGPCGAGCGDGNDCTYDECVSLSLTLSGPFVCRNEPKPEESSCDGNGQCFAGVCRPNITSQCDHEPFDPDRNFPECDDGRECTYNRCDFADQCANPNKQAGTSCDNGNGQCFLGNCQPVITPECQHQPFDPDRNFPECDDGNVCTFDRCDSADQCINPPIEFQRTCGPGGSGVCVGGTCFILP